MIKARGLSKIHDHATLLANVDLDVGRGKILGLAGVNGSGRTILLSILATLVKPTSGYLEIDGVDALRFPHRVRHLIGYVSESPCFIDHLTVREYLEFVSACRRHNSEVRPAKPMPEETFGYLQRETPIRNLSRGLRQQLAWAAALLHAPRLLLLDEPICYLDALAAARCESVLRDVRSRGGTVVVACNRIADLQSLCDEVACLHEGRLLKVIKVEGGAVSLVEALHDLIDQHLSVNSRVVPAANATGSGREPL